MPDLVLGSAATPLDLALLAWLDAKSTRSGSKKTETAYTATIYINGYAPVARSAACLATMSLREARRASVIAADHA